MKTFLRRIFAPVATALALIVAPGAFGAPPLNVTITAPAAGSLGTLSTPTNTVTFTATATPSLGAFITQVDFRVNGVSVGVSTGPVFTVSWTPIAPGTYALTAIATDSTSAPGNTLTSSTVTVTVAAVRLASITTPASNATVTQNSELFLRAAASMSDGVVGSVEFFLGGVSLGAAVTSAPYFQAPAITALPGTYNLVARATASDGVTTWDSAATYPITVVAQPGVAVPIVAFVTPAATDVIAVGNAVTVTATASDADGFIPNTAPGGVSFYADGELIGADLTAPYSVVWTPSVAKTSVTLLAIATDDKGNARSATRNVTVLAVAPTVSISAPSNNSSATVGTAVTVNANASAGTGTTLTGVQFLADGVPIATDTTAPYSVSWTPAASGTVALTARATDSIGTIVTSAAVNVNVASAPGALAVTLTAPANAATIALGTSPVFSATATAAGSATVTRVDFLVASTVVGTALTAPYTASWTPTTSGIFAVSARVTDSNGAIATSSVANVNVTAPTVALTAPAASTSVAVGATTVLTATATPVLPATVNKVEFIAGTTLVGTALAAPYTVNWVPTVTGAISLTARVTDSNNAVVTSSVVGVTVASSLPTISLSTPTNGTAIALGTSPTLTAAAAAGGGATVSRVDFLSGSTAIGTVLAAPYSITWTPTASGIFALTARITDSNGTSATSTIVNVNVTAPSVAITSPTALSTVTVGSVFAVTASAIPVVPATVTKVEFFAGSTLIDTAIAAPFTVNWTPTAAGAISLTARVTDSNGAAITSSAVNVTVGSAASPAVVVTAPINGSVVTAGGNVTLTATATPGAGATVAQVQFFTGATLVGTDSTAPYSITWVPGSATNFSITARVVDSNGASVTSAVVTVTAVAATSVSLTAPANNSNATVGTPTTVTASAAPVAGATITRVDFYAGAALVGTAPTAPYSITWTPTLAGVTTLTAQAVDSTGGPAVTSSALTVNVANSQPAVSLTAPTAGTVVTVGNNVILTAAATPGSPAPATTITQVQFLVGANIVGTDTTAPYTLTWVPTTVGNFTVTARVTDTNNNTVTSTGVTITAVATTSVAITAPAANSTATVGTATTLTASATPTLGATLTSVTFFATPPGGVATLIGAAVATAPYTVSWTPAVAGAHTLTAVALDSTGASVTSIAVPVTVNNSAPTIAIAAPLIGAVVSAGSSVTFTATAVAGSSGATVTQVQFLAGASIVATLPGNPGSPTYTTQWIPVAAGNSSLTARVTDSNGNTTTSTAVSVTVTSTTPTVVLTSPAVGTNIGIGAATTVTATATAGSGATVSRVDFLAGATVVGTALVAPYSTTWTPAAAGITALTARVTDSNGTAVTSAAINVNVVGPSVALTSPGNLAVYNANASVSLTATAAAIAPATVSRVDYFAGANLVGSATVAPYSVTWAATPVGTVSLTARVVDTNGISVTSSAVSVTVLAAAAPTATITAPATGSVVPVGIPVSITATATPGAGASVAQVQFLVGGTTIIGTTTTAVLGVYSVSWTPSSAANFNLTARVLDSASNTVTSASVTVTAVAATSVSLTAPANNSAATVGLPVMVTASAAPIAGATITQVAFLDNGVPIAGSPVLTAPYAIAWTPAAAGAAVLTAQATDSQGTVVTSAAVNVTVANAPPTISMTSPIGGSVVTIGSGVTLAVTATPGTGATIAQVQFLSGTNLLGIVTTPTVVGGSSYSIAWTPSTIGNVSLTAKVVDSAGSTATSAVVSVTASTLSPTVTLTSPASGANVELGAATTVTATASAAGSATVSRVDFLAGNTVVGTALIPTGASYAVAWTPSASGVTALTARVTDSNGTAVTSAAINVNVVGPTVAMTSPGNASVWTTNSAVTLTAAAAAVAPATVSRVDYFAGATLVGSATVAPYSVTWTASPAGTISLTARVVDSNGISATSAVVSVTVASFPPTVTLTSPASGSNIGIGAATTLTATASAVGGATVSRVDFLAGSTLVGTALAAPYSATWTPAAAGITALTARVTDSNGTAVTSVPINVIVIGPTIAITTPLIGSVVTVGTGVIVSATTTTTGGATVTQVQFLVNNTIIEIIPGGSSASYSTTAWTPGTASNFSLTARVTDSNGATTTSSAVSVTAIAPSGPAVTLDSPVALTTLSLNAATPLSATVTPAPLTSITHVEFLAGTTVIGTSVLAGPNTYTAQWTPTTSGIISLTVRATDSNGTVSTSAPVSVTVATSTGSSVALSMLPAATSIPVNSSRVLTAVAAAPAGVAHVDFYYVGTTATTLIGADTVPPYSVVFTAPNEPGAHVLRAQAFDSAGGAMMSADFAINITGQIGSAPVAGILTPTSGTFLAVNSTTTITGTAVDADGAVAGVQVFVNGSTIGLGNGGAATLSGSAWSISWSPSTTGTASISAIVTDTNGNAVAAPAVGVTVTDTLSPTVNLSLSPRTGAAAASTTLPSGAVRNLVADVTASSGRAIIRVEFFVDGTKVGEDTSVPYTVRYVAPALAAGESYRPYVLSARATDNAGSARDALLPVLVVSPIGAPPTITLLTPANNASTVPGTAVTLAATASSLIGNIASVQFYVNGSPAGVNGGNGVAAAPYISSYTPTAPGAYTIDAIATDDRGNTAVSNSAIVTASFSVPTITITAPNPNATARATPNVPITLTAAATVQVGAGASVLLVEFLLDGVQIGARTSATNAALGTYSFAWIPTAAQLGIHVLTSRVTDTNSQSATSAPVNVNVANAVGTPPAITISTTPIPGQGLQTLSQVNFLANAFANGVNTSINSVEFFLNDLSIGLASREQTTNLYRLAFDFSRIDFATAPINPNNTSQYILPLYAIARDSNNNQTVSTTSNLTVNAATSAPPVITLISLSPTTTVTQATQILFLPQFSDTDGTVTQIQLYANGVAVQTLGNPISNQSLFTYTANTPGRFNLFAVATDDTGNTAIASPAIVVQVNAVNAPDTTLTRPATNTSSTTVGAPVFLEGTARATGTTLTPTLAFIVTGTSGSRTQINGSRVGTTTTYRAIWTPTVADAYSIITQATVAGVQNTSTVSRSVTVNELIGIAPTVSISVPGSATTTSSTNFTATSSDSDGSVISVEFFVNRNSIGEAVRDQLTNTWRLTNSFVGLPVGSTEVVARSTDSSGNVMASSTSFINLVAASSIPPSITVTPSTTNAAFNRQVQLLANARDSDGTVSSVQYYANGSSLGTSTNSGTSYRVNWTPSSSGTFNVYAIATDNTGNLTISATVPVVVRRNNPVLEEAAFILQTYQDIANTTTINPLVFDDLDSRLSSGALARSDLVVTLLADPSFLPPINLLACYYVIMGQWPTPANYTTLLSTARGSVANAVNSILFSNEYFAKFGVIPTTQLLDSPTSVLPVATFLPRLHQSAGLPAPQALDVVRFRSFSQVNATQGRGYASVGLPSAIAEFVTNTNSTNTALFKRARAAALFYQLARPPVTMTVDEISDKVNALMLLPDDKTVAEAVLQDILYAYRYVTITKHPASLMVAPRSGAIFTVEAIGAPPLAYQWLLNGSPVPGATNSFLSLTNVSASNAGTFTVAITSSAATATSDPATLTLSSVATRLANISTRGVTGAGGNVLIGGFVVSGTAAQTRQMLIRVVGPTLAGAPFNVTGTLANPTLELYAGSNRNPVLTNDDWGAQTAGPTQVTAIQQATARAGAFALVQNSRDAVVLATLSPGPYTVQAAVPLNSASPTGIVLIEVYDVTVGGVAGPKAANVSTRGLVGTGTNQLIAGFVVSGAVSRRMLIRGAGPTLASFGVPGVLADPQLTLVAQDTGTTLKTNDNWASGEDASVIAAASAAAGAFPFASTSRDAAMIVMLAPGAYTVQLTGVGNTTGVGIVEVYDVDP